MTQVDWQPLRVVDLYWRDRVSPGIPKAKSFRLPFSVLLARCSNDRAQWIAQFPRIFPVQVINAPELFRGFGIFGCLHAANKARFRKKSVPLGHKMMLGNRLCPRGTDIRQDAVKFRAWLRRKHNTI